MRPRLIMIFCGFCLPLIYGCFGPPEGLRVADQKGTVPLKPVFGNPILIQQSDYVMIPFAVHGPQGQVSLSLISGSGFILSGSSGAGFSLYKAFGDYYSTGDVLWNNIVFYEKKTGRCHLLLDHPAVICKTYLPDPSQQKNATEGPKYLMFGIADADTNGDGYINGDDAVVLYLSDLAGSALTRLTPPGTQLAGVEIDGNDALYVRFLKKPEKDRKFSPEDKSVVVRVDLRHPAEGTPVFDDQLANRAYSIVTGK